MDTNSTQHMIDRYFENDLNQEELAAFEKRLSEDPNFAKAFAEEKLLIEGIEAFGNEQLRAQLDTIHAEETGQVDTSKETESPKIFDPFETPKEEGKVVKMSRRWWLAAAVIAIGIIARWLFSSSKPTPRQLYAIFAVHDFDFTEMGTNDELLVQIEELLKNEKYLEAQPLLEAYMNSNPKDSQAVMAYGITFLESNQYDQALAVFTVLARDGNLYQNEARWYTALTHLRQGDVENCKYALNAIPKSSAKYKDASKLLGYLK